MSIETAFSLLTTTLETHCAKFSTVRIQPPAQPLPFRSLSAPSAPQASQEVLDAPPVVMLPPRNSKFFGRVSILDQIRDRLQDNRQPTDPTVLTLYGLGGIGKSQIAREYAYRRKDDYRHGAILWISSETTIMVDQSFRQAASFLKLDEISEKESLRNKIAVIERLERLGKYPLHCPSLGLWLSF